MRIVYDDKMQGKMVDAVTKFMRSLDVKPLVSYEWGMNRVQMHMLKEQLNRFLARYDMSIGNRVYHAYGIGNNCMYPMYYQPKGASEIQHCGNININRGMFGEGFVSCEDYNRTRVSPMWEVHTTLIKEMPR